MYKLKINFRETDVANQTGQSGDTCIEWRQRKQQTPQQTKPLSNTDPTTTKNKGRRSVHVDTVKQV